MTAKEKMTAPIASVGADVEQPLSNKLTNQSIADLPGKGNLQATNNHDKRMNDCLPPILFSAIFKLLKVLPDTELDAC